MCFLVEAVWSSAVRLRYRTSGKGFWENGIFGNGFKNQPTFRWSVVALIPTTAVRADSPRGNLPTFSSSALSVTMSGKSAPATRSPVTSVSLSPVPRVAPVTVTVATVTCWLPGFCGDGVKTIRTCSRLSSQRLPAESGQIRRPRIPLEGLWRRSGHF